MNKQIFIAAILATMLTIAIPMTSPAHAQNATTAQGPREFRHFEGHNDHGFLGLGVRSHIGLPFVRNGLGSAVVVGGAPAGATIIGASGGQVQPRIHDFAREHHDHFIFLNNRYVYLPEAVQCPGGSILVGDQCVVQSQTIIQQEAPTILAEQAPVIQGQAAPEVTGGEAVTTTQQEQVAPANISCQPGSVLVGNECQSTTVQNSAPIITCPADTQLQGTTCVQQAQQIVVQQSCGCPEGSVAQGTQCIVTALPSAVIQGSAPDEIIVSGHHFHHFGELPFLRH